MRLRALWQFATTMLVLAVLSPSVFAQATISYAQLNGTVLDPNDAAVQDASVSARDVGTNQTYNTTTNQAGFYFMPNLPPGTYEVSITSDGFAKFVQKEMTLTVGATATLNAKLQIATVDEQVTVTTDPPAVEPTKTEISQVIDTKQITNLPTSSRRFTDFALLTPGVATSRTAVGTTFTEFEATQISFGGMRSFSNEIMVDGADFVNTNAGLQRSTPPQESVSEFRVVNNSFGAEYGRALGGIVNIVTKSGSNDLHFSAYDYLQNSALDSRSLLQPAPLRHDLRQNQFGVAVGGPIVRDKTFFFANYEAERRAQTPTFAPDLLQNFAAINRAKNYLGIPAEPQSVLTTISNDYGFARLDHRLGQNHQMALRYNVEDARDLNMLVGNTEDGGGIATPSGGRNLFLRDQSLVGTLNSVVSPNMVNSALAQYARRHYYFPGATGQPDLDVPNDLSFGHNFGTFDAIYETRTQLSDSLSWIKGNHLAKFGMDWNYVWDYTLYPGFEPERIILPNLNCLIEFANFVNKPGGPPLPSVASAPCPLPDGTIPGAPFINEDGVAAVLYGDILPRAGFVNGQAPLDNAAPLDVNTWQNAYNPQLVSNYTFTLNHGYYGFYAQDQWHLNSKLTLNYGLRYDFETGLSHQINSDYNAFQPRLGVAYSPNSKTVIRAGFGIFFDRNNLTFFNVTGNQKTPPGFLPGIALPMVQNQSAQAGWQLNQVVAPQVMPPPVPCPAGQSPAPVAAAPCFGASAAVAAYILNNGIYPDQWISGLCDPAGVITGTPQFACTAGAGGIDRAKSRLPYAEQASLQVEQEIGKGLTVQLGYLFVGAHKLVQGNSLNVSCPVGTSKPNNPSVTTATQTAAQGLLNPDGTLTGCSGTPAEIFGKQFFNGLEFNNAGFIDYNDNIDNANYHGGTISANERLGNYINLNASYTYSHTIDLGNFTTFINLPQNQFDQAAERASSNQDVRHRLIASFTASAPRHTLLRNFSLSGILNMQSGRPFTEYVGFDANNDTNAYTDRPGLIGRNSYTGDRLYSLDLRLSRFINLGERTRLFVSLDAFNVLNRQNVNEITGVYGAPEICGATPTHYNDAATLAIQRGEVSCPVVALPLNAPAADAAWASSTPPPPNPLFGAPRTVFNPRELQFSARLTF